MTVAKPPYMERLERIIDQEVQDFLKSPKSKCQVFSPIKILDISVEDYVQCFADVDSKYANILMYRSGSLYIVDTPSEGHCSTVIDICFSLRDSLPLDTKAIFKCCGVAGNIIIIYLLLDCRYKGVCLQPDNQWRIKAEHYTPGAMLMNARNIIYL